MIIFLSIKKDAKKSLPKKIITKTSIQSCQELTTASLGLPVWDLVFEDHFDRLTCVPDRNGILRPNPLSWTPEIGSSPRFVFDLLPPFLSAVSWGGELFFKKNAELAYLIVLVCPETSGGSGKLILKHGHFEKIKEPYQLPWYVALPNDASELNWGSLIRWTFHRLVGRDTLLIYMISPPKKGYKAPRTQLTSRLDMTQRKLKTSTSK